jgi:hypothetical protein
VHRERVIDADPRADRCDLGDPMAPRRSTG